jgi:hypothetical protein
MSQSKKTMRTMIAPYVTFSAYSRMVPGTELADVRMFVGLAQQAAFYIRPPLCGALVATSYYILPL